jgi:hypothetical protein
MKKILLFCSLVAIALTSSACGRHIRTAEDVTPGNFRNQKLDWRYGAADIRIQTTKLTRELLDRWACKTGYDFSTCGKPRIIITQIDNRTDTYISSDMIRDIFEGAAIDDGRFTVLVGDANDELELDFHMDRITTNPKYSNSSQLTPGLAIAPQFLAKVRITKAVNSDRFYDYEDYRMTVTLYDIETQEAIDSAWDVLQKRIKGC